MLRRPVVLLREFTNLYTYCATKPPKHYQNCSYSEWLHRRPSRIVNEHEFYDLEDTTAENTKRNVSMKTRRRSRTASEKESTETDFDDENKYKILKASDKFINQIMLQAKSRTKREKANSVIIEGLNFIRDGLEAGIKLRTLIFSKKSTRMLDSLNLPHGVQLYQIPYKTVKTWSTLATSPGIIGVFDTPDLSKTEPASDALPLTVICDNISDPRNLGSIIRAVGAVGCEKLILIKGCVDVWNPNVQRCAASAQFRLPIEMYPTWEEVNELINPNARIYLADNHTYTLFNNIKEKDNITETRSIQSEESTSESETDEEEYLEEDYEEENVKHDKSANENVKKIRHYTQAKRELRRFLSQLPIQIFYMPDYTRNEAVLVIGGETQGFSLNLQNFLHGRMAERLHIPLSNNINSLNSSMAVGILVYEIRRQYLMQELKA